jgi:hypothetical protein
MKPMVVNGESPSMVTPMGTLNWYGVFLFLAANPLLATNSTARVRPTGTAIVLFDQNSLSKRVM